MPEFNSPNFKRTVSSSEQKPLREFTVGSPDVQEQREMSRQHLSDFEQEVKHARQDKLSNMDKITNSAKKRIEILANIGRLSKDVVLEGYTFSIRTLKASEMEAATLASLNIKTNFNMEVSFALRKQQLARSLFKIDGQDVAYILGDNAVETKLSFLDELEDVVFSKLYEEFSFMRKEIEDKFTIKTEVEAKEVAEDLKK